MSLQSKAIIKVELVRQKEHQIMETNSNRKGKETKDLHFMFSNDNLK